MRFPLLLLATFALPAFAQTTAIDRGLEAYQAGRFAEATRAFTQAIEAAPDDPEARYLLARVLYDERNPDRNESRAGREINRAVDLDPDNVVYLVAQLEQLRGDSWSSIVELLRREQRRDLADRILALDSTNAFGHEELGVQAISDYYKYRNAIKLPGLTFRSEDVGRSSDPEIDSPATVLASADPNFGDVDATLSEGELGSAASFENTFGEEISDRFDIAELQRRGFTPTDFSDRARSSYERAIGHLREAIERDPRRRPVYDHLVRLAALSGEWEEVLPDLAEMFIHFPEDDGMWLYTGLVNHRLGQYEPAAVAFRQAFEHMDDDVLEAYTDLTLILPPDEHRAYRENPESFTERYWTSRDPRFLNTVNERRTEHYARLTTAELLYRSEDLDMPGWDTERGRLHVRYGVPQTDVVIEGGFGLVVEQFTGRGEFALSGAEEGLASVNRFNVWDYGDDLRFVFEDPTRNGSFRLYSPPADVFALVTAQNPGAMDFVERAQEQVRRQPERYTFEAPGRQVQLPYRVTAFKGDDGRTDLYVNYGIPVAGDPQDGVQEDVDVTVKTGAFLIGPERDLLVERRRTVYGLRGAQIVPFDQTRLWTSTEPMSAPPSEGYEVSLEFETASGQTSAVQRRAVDVPDFAGADFQLSDILLAYFVEEEDQAQPGRVFRNGVSVQPAPWGVFRAGDPVYLYLEAYGLGLEGDRTDYEVEASLRPKDTSRGLRRLARRIFGGGGAAVSSAFEAQGNSTDESVYLFLDATGQEPGLYTLTVTVRDKVTGAEADRETDLLLE
ncbi:GWxTD domain-containing protein [Rubrivirga sp.]|uniref:GWxTD domain-containing protein n=1 Tax=Rubrivirga sp. TaxID=1885344 RepID=UPI003C707325